MDNNQRNYSFPVGFSNLPCSQVGCTISVIGDVLGLTPDVVNEKLKAVQGFKGALIIWAKIPEAFPGVAVNRVWEYNNDDVLAHTPNVIVEVPAAPIGGTGKHWVDYIGNHQLKDPWTGTIRPTSDFPNPTGYCTFDLTNYKKPEDTQAIIDQLRKERDDNWNLHLADQKTIENLNDQIKDLNAKLKTANNDISEQKKQLLAKDRTIETLQVQADKLVELEKHLEQAMLDRKNCLTAQETQNRTIAQLKNSSYKTAPTNVLIFELYLRLKAKIGR